MYFQMKWFFIRIAHKRVALNFALGIMYQFQMEGSLPGFINFCLIEYGILCEKLVEFSIICGISTLFSNILTPNLATCCVKLLVYQLCKWFLDKIDFYFHNELISLCSLY